MGECVRTRTAPGIRRTRRQGACCRPIGNSERPGIAAARVFAASLSQRAPRPRGHELVTEAVQIGQSEHRLRSGQILRPAAIPHLGESPQPLHDVKRMFAPRPNARARSVDLSPPVADRSRRVTFPFWVHATDANVCCFSITTSPPPSPTAHYTWGARPMQRFPRRNHHPFAGIAATVAQACGRAGRRTRASTHPAFAV
jgi:hypothetical protein